MTFEKLEISGCYLIKNDVYKDDRGFFREWFKESLIQELMPDFVPVQANNSMSKQSVIRGLHYSLAKEGQAKLVVCAEGEILDVLADVRLGSPTFKKTIPISLTPDSGYSVLIASGVAHGFSVQSVHASVVYLTTSYYAPKLENSINPMDADLNIDWMLPNQMGHIVSPADAQAPSLNEAEKLGLLPQFN